MEPVRPLREVFAGLAGHPADAHALPAEHGDLPAELVARAIGSYAHTAPAEVAEHLSTFTGDVDTGLHLLAGAPVGDWTGEVSLSGEPEPPEPAHALDLPDHDLDVHLDAHDLDGHDFDAHELDAHDLAHADGLDFGHGDDDGDGSDSGSGDRSHEGAGDDLFDHVGPDDPGHVPVHLDADEAADLGPPPDHPEGQEPAPDHAVPEDHPSLDDGHDGADGHDPGGLEHFGG